MKKFKIIDSHCHIYPDKIAERAVAGTGSFYDMTPLLDGKISTLIKHGENAGIEHFIVQSVATSPKQASGINRFIKEAVTLGNGRFTGLGTVHPDSDNIDSEIDEIIELGLKGIKLHPDIQAVAIDDARMHRIYERCEGVLPILMHTGDSRFDYSNPNRMLPILERYPHLTVVGAHLGGWSVWDEAVLRLSKFENFCVDTSSSLYALSKERAREIILAYGEKRVLFGTDYPMWKPEIELELFMGIDLSDKAREDILYNNAARVFIK